MYAVTTLSCLILLLFGQTDAFSCKVGVSGVSRETDTECNSLISENQCQVTVTNGVTAYGCVTKGASGMCDMANTCCCSTDRCNDESFAKKCASAGNSIKQNMFILLGLLFLAYKLA